MESELLLFISQSADAFVMYNSSLQYTYINKTGAKFLGLEPEEIVGNTNRDLIGSQADTIESYVQDTFDKKEKVFVIHEISLPTGTMWFDTIYTPVFNDEQEIVRVVGVCRDVTDNKIKLQQLENLVKERTEGLKESEALYRNLIESTMAVAWEVDIASMCFTFISPQIMAISGFPAEEWVDNKFWTERIHPNDREQAVLYSETEVGMGNDHSYEYRILTADKRTVWVRNYVVVIKEEGKPIALRGNLIDITDYKLAEEERLKLEAQLKQTLKLESLSVLAGGIAHDFNNILMGVVGNADLALEDLSPQSSAYASVKEIIKAGHRASNLTSQMLAYSGKNRFVIECLDFSTVIHDMKNLFESSVTSINKLQYNLADNLPMVEADLSQLQQVIMNLVVNAAEAIGETGGVITIETCEKEFDEGCLESSPALLVPSSGGTYVIIKVSDTGCGMDEETKSKIFDPFFTTKFIGRGLGLAAVLGIVQGHRAGIAVESKPVKGTTLTLMFPALDKPVMETGNIEEEQMTVQTSNTILLVDDEEVIRSVTKLYLERLGYNILMAENGIEALDVFQEHHEQIICVLLDLTMPKMDGMKAFTELRKINRGLRVILTSGYSEEEVRKRFDSKGVAGFIQKPYEFSQLKAKLTDVLES
ncbi:MAG: PAS domain S-box protein [Proteobacteria bacterium]|nr:PAS domain S-box protein [Pseudomonadota bacterium]